MYIYILIHLILLSVVIADFSYKKQRLLVLMLIGFVMILFVGLRGETGADSMGYITFFNEQTDTIWNWKGVEKGYAEIGFYYLSVLLKSIWNNVDFYFLCISCLTIALLISSLRKYCLYPILGFCVYYSRFLIIRDMNQIRQALAMAIILYAIRFLVEQNRKHFFFLLIVSSLIHYSSIVIFPFIWLYDKKINLRYCILLLIACGICGVVGGTVMKYFLVPTGNIIALTYINTNNLGLSNPVVLYQVILCILFFYYEPLFRTRQKGYYVIRNAYLYSVVLLLLTCNLGEIGGRLATIFATCEIFIIPALVFAVRPRICGYFICWAICAFLFALNYQKLLSLPEVWSYF